MEIPGWFFNQVATVQGVKHPQDPAGGETPATTTVQVGVPVCVQQDAGGADPRDIQGRRSSVSHVRIFFRPTSPPGAAAVQALKKDDRFLVTGWKNPMVLEGDPFDVSGRGVVWEATARNAR